MSRDETTPSTMDPRAGPEPARGFDAHEIEVLYALGHSLYERGRHEDAADVFALLTFFEPTDPRFWFARGAAEQERRRLPEAIAAYSLATLLDEEDAWALVHLGECLVLDGEPTLAARAWNRAVERGTLGRDSLAVARAEAFLRDLEVPRAG